MYTNDIFFFFTDMILKEFMVTFGTSRKIIHVDQDKIESLREIIREKFGIRSSIVIQSSAQIGKIMWILKLIV